jgi:hypothetical protein
MAYIFTEAAEGVKQPKQPKLKSRVPGYSPKVLVERLKQGIQVTKAQRDRERLALKFMDPKFQWAPEHIAAREGTTIGSATIPARPMISVSKIEQPIQLVQNGFQNANLDINVHPLSPGAEKKTAEIFNGIIRQIVRDSNATVPRSWAFERATEAGFGCYRILTEYDDSSDDPEDQKILIKRIRYQEAVVFDPAANESDYSDGRFAFITSYMPVEQFKAAYPNAEISSATDGIFADIQKDRPEWVDFDSGDGQGKGILVAEYYCKHERMEGKKKITDVWWQKVCPGTTEEVEVLEEELWNGQYIPIIPVIGKELQPFDKERRYQGIVEPAMDAQRGYNYAITTALELAALEPKSPFVGAEGSFDGHETKWNSANTRNWAYMEYKPTSFEGQLVPPPQRQQIDAGRLSVSMQLAAIFDQAIQATTSTPDPALGKHSRDESGKAIEALQSQSVASTSNYMSNMAQISLILEGKILVDMIPRIYGGRKGRIVRIVDVQDETDEVIIGAPFVMDPNTGRPTMNVAVQPNAKPEVYDLTQGKFGLAVKVGKSYDSRFEQGRDQMTQLLQADPTLMPILGDIFFKYNDAPWSPEAEKRMKKVIEKANPDFYKADKPGAETPEQLRQMLSAATQQIEGLNQQLQMAMQAIQTDQAKQQAQLEKANIDAQTKMQTGQMNAETQTQLAQMEAMLKVKLEEMQAEADLKIKALQEAAETERLVMQQRFEAMQSELDRQQEEKNLERQAEIAQSQAESAQAHEAGMEGQRRENEGDE